MVYLEHHNWYPDSKIRRILHDVSTFAMVGASTVWRRPSFYAMKYLQHKGFRIIPVNPGRAGGEVLGELAGSRSVEMPGHRGPAIGLLIRRLRAGRGGARRCEGAPRARRVP